jgi:hypothetical protein
MRRILSACVLGTWLLHATPTVAQHARPTPHELLDEAMRPVTRALDDLHATDAERHDAADTLSQAESLAAGIVEAQHRGATDRAHSLSHRMELLARTVRGRIEAVRAEARASDAERSALAAESRRVRARAALERAAELRLEAERGAAPEPSRSSSPPASSSPAPGPAATP